MFESITRAIQKLRRIHENIFGTESQDLLKKYNSKSIDLNKILNRSLKFKFKTIIFKYSTNDHHD